MAVDSFTFSPPAALLSMNVALRNHGAKNANVLKEWRDAAYFAWCLAHPGVGPSGRRAGPSVVHTALPVPNRIRRDPHNFVVTVKAIVDGMVLAGAWPDDTPEFVKVAEPALVGGVLEVAVRLTPLTADPAWHPSEPG